MVHKTTLILTVLMLLLAAYQAQDSDAGGAHHKGIFYTIAAYNDHLKEFFTKGQQYINQGGGVAGVYANFLDIKNEFENKFETCILQGNDLDHFLSQAAKRYIRIEQRTFEIIFGRTLNENEKTGWGGYLTNAQLMWTQYYSKYYTDREDIGGLFGYSANTINAYAAYWRMVSPLMTQFLDGETPNKSHLDSIKNIGIPDKPPQPKRSSPVEYNARLADEMIEQAAGIPRVLLEQAQRYITDGDVWTSTFGNWKADMKGRINRENSVIQKFQGMLEQKQTQ